MSGFACVKAACPVLMLAVQRFGVDVQELSASSQLEVANLGRYTLNTFKTDSPDPVFGPKHAETN